MTENTMPAGALVTLPPPLVELWQLLAAHRPAVHQARCFDRLRARVMGQVCSRAGTRGTWAEQEAWLHRLDALFAAAVPM